MGFRDKQNKEKDINRNDFGVGSCIVCGNGRAFILSTDETSTKLYLTDTKTFKTYLVDELFEDVYHITLGEAYWLSNKVNGILNEANTRSDYGWNSNGIKDIRVEYDDN